MRPFCCFQPKVTLLTRCRRLRLPCQNSVSLPTLAISCGSWRLRIGSNHLPRDAIEIITSSTAAQVQNTNYGQGIVDEAMQWNRDREGSSVDSASDSGVTSGDSSGQSSRGLDPATLYFKKEDVILLVDGELLCNVPDRSESVFAGRMVEVSSCPNHSARNTSGPRCAKQMSVRR